MENPLLRIVRDFFKDGSGMGWEMVVTDRDIQLRLNGLPVAELKRIRQFPKAGEQWEFRHRPDIAVPRNVTVQTPDGKRGSSKKVNALMSFIDDGNARRGK